MGFHVRSKEHGHLGWAQRLNPHAVLPAEMIVQFPEGDAGSEYVRDWDPADPNLAHEDLWKYLEQEERNRIG